MELIKFLGWFLLNVGVPLLAPLALLPLLGAGRKDRGKVKVLIRWAIRDGQLYWPVVAMCAAACYDAAGTFANPRAEPGTVNSTLAWLAIGWHVLIIVVSSVLVTVGAMDITATKAREVNEGALSPLVLISITLSITTALTFSATHYFAS
jgi:hypothetical protein